MAADLILSIQSHVAYGYVGNKAAVFPLQRLGFDVVDINTVQFSNHTGYGSWTGDAFKADHISAILDGIEARGVYPRIRAVLSGYLGDPGLGQIVTETVHKLKTIDPGLIYCCDPVMGDTGRGFFVKAGIPEFFKETASASATIMTPNQFELNHLSGMTIETLDDAITACQKLLKSGPEIILLTSLEHRETPAGKIQMLAINRAGQQFIVTTPKLEVAVNGSGDATSALFLGHYIRTGNLKDALGLTASAIYSVFDKTFALQSRELALIAAQDNFDPQDPAFSAEEIQI